MIYTTIEYEVKNNIGWIFLNRPNHGNALDLNMAKELKDVAFNIAHDEDVSVVILTGNGKVFSFGGDLHTFLGNEENNGQKLKSLTMNLNEFINQMHQMKKPIITGVNGTAAGAGMGLSILGDIILAQENAKFTMAYTNVGLTPDGSISYYLPKMIGLNRALELTLTNRVLTAHEALEWGMVTRVVQSKDLIPELEKIAEKLVLGPKEAIKNAKALLYYSYNQSLESQISLESHLISEQINKFEGIEGVTAFVEKRKPNFK